MATLYMGGTPETVGRYVLFSGDPWRVNVIKQFFERFAGGRLYAGVQHLHRHL